MEGWLNEGTILFLGSPTNPFSLSRLLSGDDFLLVLKVNLDVAK